MYGKGVEERIRAVRFQGDLERETVRVEKRNPICGDLLRLSLEIDAGVVRDVRWKAEGCPPTLAAADVLAEIAKGELVAKLRALEASEIEARLDGLPATSRHAVQLAVAALREALSRI